MIHRTQTDDHDCVRARELISARLDGELTEPEALEAHLALCGKCRAHERTLATIARGFAALREPAALPDLWPRIERGARPRRLVPALARVAAALVGFVGLGGTALVLEREGARHPERHLLERLAPRASGPDVLFASLPEYRLLRALPAPEESR
jgi:anti-sigma factor RsiW